MSLAAHRRDWEDMARVDPYWAVVSAPDKRGGSWEAQDLLRTGVTRVDSLVRRARRLGHPVEWRAALDFGCGVGRLTQALDPHFEECVGVDISEEMLAEARRLAGGASGMRFVRNDGDDLSQFADGSFDLVYSHIVLQHVPDRASVMSYIAEFVRVLAPGGLVAFQLPSRIAARHRLQPHRRAWGALRRLGVSPAELYRLGLQPIHMGAAPVVDITAALERGGGRVLAVDTNRIHGGNESSTYWATREERVSPAPFQPTRRSSAPRRAVERVMRPITGDTAQLRHELAVSARKLERERQRSKHWKEAANRHQEAAERWKEEAGRHKEEAGRKERPEV